MDAPTTPPTASASESQPTSSPSSATRPARPNEWRKPAGLIISMAIIVGAVVLSLWVWNVTERHPRTDDAVVRANVVGIAPRVRGQIIRLNVQDNQAVADGDVLFEIDPADYELSLQKAKAALATLDQQIKGGGEKEAHN